MIVIDGDMTIVKAAETKSRLLKALQTNDSISLDLSGVETFDSSGFQLLYMIKREAETDNKPFRIKSFSQAVEDTLTLYAMMGHFGLKCKNEVIK